MKAKTMTTRTVKTEEVYQFDESDIIAALRETGRLPAKDVTEPHSVEVWVRVPGGGDWSNTNLELDDCPLNVKVTTFKEIIQ